MTFVSNGTATLTDAEMRAISDENAAQLATKQADLDRALLAMCEAQELNSQWRLDWKASQDKLAAAEADAKEWQARAMGLVFHVPADKMLGDIQDARQRWIDAEADAARWHDGVPPKPFDSEWFIAELKSGDRAVLRALPEEYAYDYKTADESYLKKTLVVRWMQFPDSQFVRFAAPQPHAGGSEGL